MTEFVLCIVFFIPVLLGLLEFGQFILVKKRAHSVARLGTWLQTSGLVSAETAWNETRAYADHLKKPAGSTMETQMGRFLETASSKFYKLYFTSVHMKIPGPFLQRIGLGSEVEIRERVVMQKE